MECDKEGKVTMAQARETLARFPVQITMLAEPGHVSRAAALIPRDETGAPRRTKSDIYRRAIELGLAAMESDASLIP